LFRSGVGGQVQTGWLGIFSQAGGLVRVMGKALRKVMITICSHGPWSMCQKVKRAGAIPNCVDGLSLL